MTLVKLPNFSKFQVLSSASKDNDRVNVIMGNCVDSMTNTRNAHSTIPGK